MEVEEGVYTIYSKLKSNMVLDISGGSTVSGGNLQIYQYNGTTSQLFWIEKTDSSYTITPMCSGLPLDVQGGNMTSGAHVQQYYSNGTNAQKWKFYDIGNGYCFIARDKLALDVSGGNSTNGTNVQIYKRNDTASQMWNLKKVYSARATSSLKKYTDSENTCIVKINTSLINKKGYQKASVKLMTYEEGIFDEKSTDGKLWVTLKDMSNKTIWRGVKSGGDTIKLGDDYPAYKITVERYDSGNGAFSNGNDFINIAKTAKWGLINPKNCKLYTVD